MVTWEGWGMLAMGAIFVVISIVQSRGKFGEARFDSKTGKRIDDD